MLDQPPKRGCSNQTLKLPLEWESSYELVVAKVANIFKAKRQHDAERVGYVQTDFQIMRYAFYKITWSNRCIKQSESFSTMFSSHSHGYCRATDQSWKLLWSKMIKITFFNFKVFTLFFKYLPNSLSYWKQSHSFWTKRKKSLTFLTYVFQQVSIFIIINGYPTLILKFASFL